MKCRINITLIDGTEILGKETDRQIVLTGQERFIGFFEDEEKTSIKYIPTKRVAEFVTYLDSE